MKLTTQVVLAVLCFSAVGNVQATFFESFSNLRCPCVNGDKCELADQWITQKLDHFDKSETRTWPMRYIANNEYFKKGGPMFVFIGGEWEISESDIRCGHFHDMAKEHKGYLFHTEHRYYGKSNPTAELAMANVKDEFKYLNAQQALADLEYFILTIKETIPELKKSKVIIAGSSYAGSLAVWLKKLHPNLVDGGWASSAPLLAKLDFSEYYAFVVEKYRQLGGVECYNRIQDGIDNLENMLNNGQGPYFLNEDFDEKNPLDKQSLFEKILIGFGGNLMKNDIKKTCELVMKGRKHVSNLLLIDDPLFTYYGLSFKNTIKIISNRKSYKDTYIFLYQRCNEFGWFGTYEKLIPSSYYTQKCAELFGEEFTDSYIEQKIAKTNEFFGGLYPNVQNIYISHGEDDPWIFLGLKDGATIIPGAFHGTDFRSISSDDNKEMRASKKQLAQKVREWIRQ